MVAGKLRYLVLELLIDAARKKQHRFSQKHVFGAIKKSVQDNFGLYGAAICANYLQVKYFNPVTNIVVVRCSRQEYTKIWSSITFIRAIENIPTLFNLLILSGSTRACRKKLEQVEADRLELLEKTPGLNLSPEEIKEAQAYTKRNVSLE